MAECQQPAIGEFFVMDVKSHKRLIRRKPANLFDQFLASRLWCYSVLSFDFLTERLKEESTWRGIVAILTGLGVALDPQSVTQIVSTGLVIIGAINFFKHENRKYIHGLEHKVVVTRRTPRPAGARKPAVKSATKGAKNVSRRPVKH